MVPSTVVPSSWQQKALRFDSQERSTERTDADVETCGLGRLQIRKEARDPRCNVVIEDFAISPRRGEDCPATEACHDFQKSRDMIFRLRGFLEPFHTDAPEHLAKIDKRAPVEESSQIVGRIREQFAASEPGEESVVFPGDLGDIRACRGFSKRRVRQAQRSAIPPQASQTGQHLGVWAAPQQSREQGIFLCPGKI